MVARGDGVQFQRAHTLRKEGEADAACGHFKGLAFGADDVCVGAAEWDAEALGEIADEAIFGF